MQFAHCVAGEMLLWLLIRIKSSGGAAGGDGMGLIHKRVTLTQMELYTHKW